MPRQVRERKTKGKETKMAITELEHKAIRPSRYQGASYMVIGCNADGDLRPICLGSYRQCVAYLNQARAQKA